MDKYLKEDIDKIKENKEIVFSDLSGKVVFVTGATGVIGYNFISTILSLNEDMDIPVKIIALVRNQEKAKKMFGENDNLIFISGDVTDPIHIETDIDYIVHAASQTSSRAFIEEPLNVIDVAISGTINTLELAKEKNVSAYIYLSTMEVYGAPESEEKITEMHSCNIDTMKVRSSYPESKRMCECICASYLQQYSIPVKVIRLTQTFGPGVRYDDNRVFAEFARCAIEKKDIILHTYGKTKRNYLYTADAVLAILIVLQKGKKGQAYNAANEDTYCTIYDMAKMVCDKCADGKINVVIDVDESNMRGYAPTLIMNLDTNKIRSLGWKPYYSLPEMFERLCDSMKEEKKITS